MDMENRQKAQDVFNEANFLFGTKTTFSKAFPQIEKISVEVTEMGQGVSRSDWNTLYYGKSDLAEYINCSNPLCYNGGFRIAAIVREMTTQKETERTGKEYCRGYEGSPKGKRRYKDCFNSFEYKIRIEYNESEK
jgi:hypothetical protein